MGRCRWRSVIVGTVTWSRPSCAASGSAGAGGEQSTGRTTSARARISAASLDGSGGGVNVPTSRPASTFRTAARSMRRRTRLLDELQQQHDLVRGPRSAAVAEISTRPARPVSGPDGVADRSGDEQDLLGQHSARHDLVREPRRHRWRRDAATPCGATVERAGGVAIDPATNKIYWAELRRTT